MSCKHWNILVFIIRSFDDCLSKIQKRKDKIFVQSRDLNTVFYKGAFQAFSNAWDVLYFSIWRGRTSL